MKAAKRHFRIVYDDGPPGLWSSLSGPSEVARLLAAFKQAGMTVEEIDAQEAKRIRRQDSRAEAKKDTDE